MLNLKHAASAVRELVANPPAKTTARHLETYNALLAALVFAMATNKPHAEITEALMIAANQLPATASDISIPARPADAGHDQNQAKKAA